MDGREYVYVEPQLTQMIELTERLKAYISKVFSSFLKPPLLTPA